MRALLAAFVASVVAAAIATAAPGTPTHCGPVPVDSMPTTHVDALTAAGWRGDPTDGMEALYPPGCHA